MPIQLTCSRYAPNMANYHFLRHFQACCFIPFSLSIPITTSTLYLYNTQTKYPNFNAENVLIAGPRNDSGSRSAAKLRKSGRVPGILFSLPGEESRLLTFDRKDISTRLNKLGRTGWACHVFNVQVASNEATQEPITFPALVREHFN